MQLSKYNRKKHESYKYVHFERKKINHIIISSFLQICQFFEKEKNICLWISKLPTYIFSFNWGLNILPIYNFFPFLKIDIFDTNHELIL